MFDEVVFAEQNGLPSLGRGSNPGDGLILIKGIVMAAALIALAPDAAVGEHAPEASPRPKSRPRAAASPTPRCLRRRGRL
jgi:hypothetical protein